MSTLHVENLKGLSSGGNANKVIIPTGQTLEVTDNIRYDDMPAGSVIQTVDSSSTSVVTTSSADTWVNSGDTITITPKFATSKLHILVYAAGETYGWSNQGTGYRILNGSTQVYDNEYSNYNSNSNTQRIDKVVLLHIESAASTSARTYTLQVRVRGNGSARHNQYGEPSRLVIMEIAQ